MEVLLRPLGKSGGAERRRCEAGALAEGGNGRGTRPPRSAAGFGIPAAKSAAYRGPTSSACTMLQAFGARHSEYVLTSHAVAKQKSKEQRSTKCDPQSRSSSPATVRKRAGGIQRVGQGPRPASHSVGMWGTSAPPCLVSLGCRCRSTKPRNRCRT